MGTERVVGGQTGENKLKVYNTITKEKEELKVEGGVVKWYTCGPTVYDSAHLGHARSYVLQDSIRKTLERYFGYTITYIMNITDVDDKIIIKAREVMSRGKAESKEETRSEEDVKKKIANFEVTEENTRTEEQTKMHAAMDEVSRKYEKEFFRDMLSLGVEMPTYVTRVSEYIEEIKGFIEKIESEGYAYEVEGSVYFDTRKYKETHAYPQMCTGHNQDEALEEGEGSLAENKKRHRGDFVLWKRSKSEEPVWASKWGPGRPGWHIECSAMASNIANGRIDVHSGGIDLMFPHHDNEIAQSEGAGVKGWVGHFIHMGHLHINGLKMSKSLKNFVKVEELLKSGTARELRMMFLLQSYRGPMTYGDDSLERAKVVERKIFRYVSLYGRKYPDLEKSDIGAVKPFGGEEHALMQELDRKVVEIDQAIKDDFNYPRAIELVVELVGTAEKTQHKEMRAQVSEVVKRIMHSVGLEVEEAKESAKEGLLLEAVSEFRNKIRALAKTGGGKKEYFEACDEVRALLSSYGLLIEDSNVSENSTYQK